MKIIQQELADTLRSLMNGDHLKGCGIAINNPKVKSCNCHKILAVLKEHDTDMEAIQLIRELRQE